MRVAARAALMLSLMAMGEVVRGEPSLLIMSLRSCRVRPFLDVGALGVVWGVAAAGAGFADGAEAFSLPFLATWAHVDGAGVDATKGGGGAGGGCAAGGSGVDPEAFAGGGGAVRRGSNYSKFAFAQSTDLLSLACCSSSAWECYSVMEMFPCAWVSASRSARRACLYSPNSFCRFQISSLCLSRMLEYMSRTFS